MTREFINGIGEREEGKKNMNKRQGRVKERTKKWQGRASHKITKRGEYEKKNVKEVKDESWEVVRERGRESYRKKR